MNVIAIDRSGASDGASKPLREMGDGTPRGAADVDPVPRISAFYGITIYMYWRDHAPPHFHAEYGEHEATIDIESAQVLQGSLPPTARKLVEQWAATNREPLKENWALCMTKTPPKRIPPLE